jgi:hypothetical protein
MGVILMGSKALTLASREVAGRGMDKNEHSWFVTDIWSFEFRLAIGLYSHNERTKDCLLRVTL